MVDELSNSWMFFCMSFDLVKQMFALAVSNRAVYARKLEPLQIEVLQSVVRLQIWWKYRFLDFIFPEKVSLLNIFRNNRGVDKYVCGEAGDLYSWDIKGKKAIPYFIFFNDLLSRVL